MVEVHDLLAPKQNVVGLLLTIFLVFLCLALAGGLFIGWTLLERGKCGTGDHTLRDELRVKTFALGVFGAPDWKETYSTAPYHVMRTRLSETYTWALLDGQYRILETFMAFPAEKQDVMNEYAKRLFPNLSSCP